MNRYKKYNKKGMSLCLLQRAFGHRRHFDRLVRLLEALGKHCFDIRSDGVFAVGALLQLPLSSHFRTLRYSHLPDLIKCGAIEPLGLDQYGVEQFRIVGFLDYNMSAKQMDELCAWEKEDWVRRQRRHRSGGQTFTSTRDNVKAQQEENAHSIENSASSVRCHAQPTKPTPSERVRSETNGFSPCTTGVPEVGSPREDKKQAHQKLFASAADVLREMGAPLQQQIKPNNKICKISEEEIAAVEAEIAGSDTKAAKGAAGLEGTNVASAPPEKAEKLPTRIARMPKTKSPIFQNHVEDAFIKALGYLPSSSTVQGYRSHMTVLGACKEELEYAAQEVNRQRTKGNTIFSPVALMTSIIVYQKQARLGLA